MNSFLHRFSYKNNSSSTASLYKVWLMVSTCSHLNSVFTRAIRYTHKEYKQTEVSHLQVCIYGEFFLLSLKEGLKGLPVS